MADSSMVAVAIAAAIDQRRDYINAQLAQAGPFVLQNVIAYWKPAPAGADYPIVMVQHISEEYAWFSMPNNYITVYEFDIYGMIRGNEPEPIARSVEKFAGAIKDIMLQRNMSLQLQDGTIPFYTDSRGNPYTPIQETKYIEILSGQAQLSRGFRLRFKCSVVNGVTDIDAYANEVNQPNEI